MNNAYISYIHEDAMIQWEREAEVQRQIKYIEEDYIRDIQDQEDIEAWGKAVP